MTASRSRLAKTTAKILSKSGKSLPGSANSSKTRQLTHKGHILYHDLETAAVGCSKLIYAGALSNEIPLAVASGSEPPVYLLLHCAGCHTESHTVGNAVSAILHDKERKKTKTCSFFLEIRSAEASLVK